MTEALAAGAVTTGMAIAIAVARLAAAPAGHRRGPTTAAALASIVALALFGLGGGRPEPLLFGAFGTFLGARVARDHARRVPGTTEPALRRRAVRGLLLTLLFALAALIAANSPVERSESAEGMFYRIFGVILPCSLIAGWFFSGAIAPGYAWLRTRGRAGD